MKNVGAVKVISAEERTSKRGNPYFRCVGMSDENQPTVFFARVEDNPKPGMEYTQILTYDNTLSAVIRYEKKNG